MLFFLGLLNTSNVAVFFADPDPGLFIVDLNPYFTGVESGSAISIFGPESLIRNIGKVTKGGGGHLAGNSEKICICTKGLNLTWHQLRVLKFFRFTHFANI